MACLLKHKGICNYSIMFFINPEAMLKADKQRLNSNCYWLNLNVH